MRHLIIIDLNLASRFVWKCSSRCRKIKPVLLYNFVCVFACFCFLFVCLFVCLGLYLWHMKVSRLGVKSELQPLAYATATVTPDLSRICNLHHSSWQRRILKPQSEAGDRTTSVLYHWAMTGTPTTSNSHTYVLYFCPGRANVSSWLKF